jgi:hypothetical protein
MFGPDMTVIVPPFEMLNEWAVQLVVGGDVLDAGVRPRASGNAAAIAGITVATENQRRLASSATTTAFRRDPASRSISKFLIMGPPPVAELTNRA